MAKVKRGGTGVRRAAKSQSRAANARRAKAKTTSVVDSAMGVLPFTEDQWSRIWLAVIIGGAVGLLWIIANLAGVPAMAHSEVSRIAADAGFEVRQIRVTGTNRMDERKVYAVISDQIGQPMPQIDLEEVRRRVSNDLSWVKDARVSAQLPSTLRIDIVEREPHAVLEKENRLMLIDIEGKQLAPVTSKAAKDMLRISGPGSAMQIVNLETLLASAPALRPQIVAAEWLGNRRWNLTFKSGQVLVLPEGAKESSNALIKFAKMDGQNRLLGGKVATFDMRVPDRVFLRIPGRGDAIEYGTGEVEATP
jgi:cell division protein FtsQ